MKTDFKVYKRKIHVYMEASYAAKAKTGHKWGYAWSTNAYRTCRDAVAAAKAKHPAFEFKASFAR